MNPNNPDPRLKLTASFVKNGASVADIGTDHAALPIYLVSQGVCPGAIASDLRTGPLESAKNNIRAAGLEGKIKTLLSDGFSEYNENDFDEAVMAGMGGLLIIKLLSAVDWIKKKVLILQPMSDAHELRYWLYENGFHIVREQAASEKQRVYTVIRAEYCGKKRRITPLEAYTGKLSESFDRAAEEFIKKQIRSLDKQICGIKASANGGDTGESEQLKNELEGFIANGGKIK